LEPITSCPCQCWSDFSHRWCSRPTPESPFWSTSFHSEWWASSCSYELLPKLDPTHASAQPPAAVAGHGAAWLEQEGQRQKGEPRQLEWNWRNQPMLSCTAPLWMPETTFDELNKGSSFTGVSTSQPRCHCTYNLRGRLYHQSGAAVTTEPGKRTPAHRLEGRRWEECLSSMSIVAGVIPYEVPSCYVQPPPGDQCAVSGLVSCCSNLRFLAWMNRPTRAQKRKCSPSCVPLQYRPGGCHRGGCAPGRRVRRLASTKHRSTVPEWRVWSLVPAIARLRLQRSAPEPQQHEIRFEVSRLDLAEHELSLSP
jgi:hypothetical protein